MASNMAVWKWTIRELPNDSEQVWVRVFPWQTAPAKAKFNASSQEFQMEDIDATLPWWTVARWKSQ